MKRNNSKKPQRALSHRRSPWASRPSNPASTRRPSLFVLRAAARYVPLAALGLFLGFAVLSTLLPGPAAVSRAADVQADVPRAVWSDPNLPRVSAAPAAPAPATPVSEEQASWQRDRATPGVRPAPQFHPRDDGEWQGMLVDLTSQAVCGAADGCGLAMACHDAVCGPCTQDSECASGEQCVLDHCVESRNVSCTTAWDCRADELCVLSGYSSDIRGNRDMLAFCQSSAGGEEIESAAEVPLDEDEGVVIPRPLGIADLRAALLDDDEWSADGEPMPRDDDSGFTRSFEDDGDRASHDETANPGEASSEGFLR